MPLPANFIARKCSEPSFFFRDPAPTKPLTLPPLEPVFHSGKPSLKSNLAYESENSGNYGQNQMEGFPPELLPVNLAIKRSKGNAFTNSFVAGAYRDTRMGVDDLRALRIERLRKKQSVIDAAKGAVAADIERLKTLTALAAQRKADRQRRRFEAMLHRGALALQKLCRKRSARIEASRRRWDRLVQNRAARIIQRCGLKFMAFKYATRAHSQVGKKRTEEERSEDARIAATFLTSLMEHNEKGEDNEGNFIVSIEFGSIEKREQEKLRHRCARLIQRRMRRFIAAYRLEAEKLRLGTLRSCFVGWMLLHWPQGPPSAGGAPIEAPAPISPSPSLSSGSSPFGDFLAPLQTMLHQPPTVTKASPDPKPPATSPMKSSGLEHLKSAAASVTKKSRLGSDDNHFHGHDSHHDAFTGTFIPGLIAKARREKEEAQRGAALAVQCSWRCLAARRKLGVKKRQRLEASAIAAHRAAQAMVARLPKEVPERTRAPRWLADDASLATSLPSQRARRHAAAMQPPVGVMSLSRTARSTFWLDNDPSLGPPRSGVRQLSSSAHGSSVRSMLATFPSGGRK